MNGPDITKAVLIVNLVALILYDIAVLWGWGLSSTISVVAYDIAREHPLVAVGVGLVIGHVFFPLASR